MGKIKPLYPDCKLSCLIAADTHIDILHPRPWLPKFRLNRMINDAARSHSDAFIIVGDTTSRGNAVNWKLTEECFAKYRLRKIILALGNHDTWHDDGYAKAIEEFYTATEHICGEKREKPYFSYDLSGYRFIFLGSVGEGDGHPILGQTQIDWLKAQCNDASEEPIFVFNHESLNQRHGLPESGESHPEPNMDPMQSGIGEESDKVAEILKSRKNVWFFSGHSHMGFCGEKWAYSSIETEDDLVLVNLPSVGCGNHSGEDNRKCVGIVLEVYADRVVLRLRDYKFRRWITSVSIQNGKPFFEKSV